jgi:hypothetical protein
VGTFQLGAVARDRQALRGWLSGAFNVVTSDGVAQIFTGSRPRRRLHRWHLRIFRGLDFTREPRRPDFYLISGFLMAMILNGKYADTPHGNWLFYTNRAVKIFAPCYAIRPQTDRADSGHFVSLIWPSLFLPLECCLGTIPIKAEKLRPDRKELGSANGSHQSRGQPRPTPEASSSLMLISLDRRQALISRSNSRTCSLILRH